MNLENFPMLELSNCSIHQISDAATIKNYYSDHSSDDSRAISLEINGFSAN